MGSLTSFPLVSARRNALIDMDAPEPQQPMQTGWMSYNPYQAQQQAQMEEYMRQQQLLELQRQVRLARRH
jgi:epsin